jgi:hypothetical protein
VGNYTIIQGGEVILGKIKAGRALFHVQIVCTMMQFVIFMEFKGPKWTQMKVARQLLSIPKVQNLIEVG